jgi:hypothetical protein
MPHTGRGITTDPVHTDLLLFPLLTLIPVGESTQALATSRHDPLSESGRPCRNPKCRSHDAANRKPCEAY